MDTAKRVVPPIPFVYWFVLQSLRHHMCCRAIKNKLIGVAEIAYQCLLYRIQNQSDQIGRFIAVCVTFWAPRRQNIWPKLHFLGYIFSKHTGPNWCRGIKINIYSNSAKLPLLFLYLGLLALFSWLANLMKLRIRSSSISFQLLDGVTGSEFWFWFWLALPEISFSVVSDFPEFFFKFLLHVSFGVALNCSKKVDRSKTKKHKI